MKNYILLSFSLIIISCSTASPVIETGVSDGSSGFEGIFKGGKAKLFSPTKHYHAGLDVEHSHARPSYQHKKSDLGGTSGSAGINDQKHNHNGKTHQHYTPFSLPHDHRHLF